jgi:hypothetical protein
MVVFKKNAQGFIEELHTVGNYKPKGWSTTAYNAGKRNNKSRREMLIHKKNRQGTVDTIHIVGSYQRGFNYDN